MYLEEEIKALQKPLALEEEGDKKEESENKAQLEAYETQLRGLNKIYWDFRRHSGEIEGNMPNGIL